VNENRDMWYVVYWGRRTIDNKYKYMGKKILCFADAPGPAEFLLPCLSHLEKAGEVKVMAFGKAEGILKTVTNLKVVTDEVSALAVYEDFLPDILVVAISSLAKGPFIERALLGRAKADSVPVVILQDIWANHRWPHNAETLIHSDAFCTLDEYGKKLLIEDGYPGKVFVTGNPGFDRLIATDVSVRRAEIRKRLGIGEGERVVFYAGQGTPREFLEDKTAFKILCDALRLLPAVRLIAKPHPRAEVTDYYTEYSSNLNFIEIKENYMSEDILPAADVVISIFATNLVHACYLKIPAVSILVGKEKSPTLAGLRLSNFPPNKSGASVGFYDSDPGELSLLMEKILSGKAFRDQITENQARHFKLDGKSVERVGEVIETILHQSNIQITTFSHS